MKTMARELSGIALKGAPLPLVKGTEFETKSGRAVWRIERLYSFGEGQSYIEAVSAAGTRRTFKPAQVAAVLVGGMR